MKKSKMLLGLAILAAIGLFGIAADHIDAPAVQGGTSDITDYFSFQGEDSNNLVFVANVQGLLSPGETANAVFEENVLVEFNIDNNGDNVEDLVIQAIPINGKMYFYGPAAPTATGITSTILTEAIAAEVEITAYGTDAILESRNGMRYFAGPRDDPFFFDFGRFNEILSGNATSFNNPGTDTFAGTNVLSIVVEVPKDMLGGSGSLNTWVETKRKQ